MKTTKEIIDEAISLPIEDRALIADKLLQSLNPSDEKIEKLWLNEAKKRVGEHKSGKVKPISGEQVFDHIFKRFGK